MSSRTYRLPESGYQQSRYGHGSQLRDVRRAWENDNRQSPSQQQKQQQQQPYSTDGQLSPSSAQADHKRSGSRSPSITRGQNRMAVEDSPDSSREKSPLINTAELFKTLQCLPSLVEESKKEIRAMNRSVSSQSSDDTAQLRGELEQMMMEKQRLETRCQELSTNRVENDKIQRLEENLKKVKESKEQYKKKYNDMALQYKVEHDKVEDLEKMVRKHETDMDAVSKQWESLNKQLQRKHELCEKAETDKKKCEAELAECKTRLSRLMGNKLANNNPDIADLSDKNRPTKLAEKNQELYDNQWTDAFEVFEERLGDEKKAIQMLLQVLKDIKTQCEKATKEQEQKLQEAVVLKRTRDCNLPDHVFKQLKDFRKAITEATLPEVHEKCLSAVGYKGYASFLKDEGVKPFFRGCVELCWLMSVQDPPLAFGEAPRSMDEFDSNTFKHYTKTGPYIDYIVWPALYLHQGGPLLSKGIAQAYGKAQNVPAKRVTREQPPVEKVVPEVSQHVESEPPGQTIDRHTPSKERNKYQGYGDASSDVHRYNFEGQNYQQSVVRGTQSTPDSSRGFSHTTKERESSSVADRFNKNFGVSQKENVPSKVLPKMPDTASWDSFIRLAKIYGINSSILKRTLGEKYETCLAYYTFLCEK